MRGRFVSEIFVIIGVKMFGVESVDIIIEDGWIVEIGMGFICMGVCVIDVVGLVVLLGFVDLYIYLCEFGYEVFEMIFIGMWVVVVGGFMVVFVMLNILFVVDIVGVVEQELVFGEVVGYVMVQFIGVVIVGQKGECFVELGVMVILCVQVCVFSDDGFCVFDLFIMWCVLEYVKFFDGVIVQYVQDFCFIEGVQMNEGMVLVEFGLIGWFVVVEELIIVCDVFFVEYVGLWLYVCYFFMVGLVDIICWVKKCGIDVMVEVILYYLLLIDEFVCGYDVCYKVNLFLCWEEDVFVVCEGFVDGMIDIVVIDYVLYFSEYKVCEWQVVVNGMVGFESVLCVVYQLMVQIGLFEWFDIVCVMSVVLVWIGWFFGYGILFEVGQLVQFMLYDVLVDGVFMEVDLYGCSVNLLYLGCVLFGWVEYMVYDGMLMVVGGVFVEEFGV